MDASESTLHLQIQFFTRDEKFLTHLPDEVINVPASSDTEQLNLLLNKISEVANENWESTNFDFLIDSILLRTSLSDFIETFKYSLESTLKLECIQQTSAPQPHLDLADAEWVADLKMTGTNCILSVNFGGELILWNGAKKVEKAVVLKLDDEPLKCLQVFRKESEAFALVGAQNQTLTLLRIEELENKKKQKAFALNPLAVFRGHQRSVECVAVNREGTRAASGSFDKCIKVWNIDEISSDDFSSATSSKSAESESRKKRARPEVPTKTPMVTLQSHREVVSDIGWNPLDPGQAVTVSWDQQMLVWDLELAGPIANLSSSRAFTALALNPHNGLALTGSTDPLVRLWDFRSKEGSMVKSAYSGHLGWVTDVCWSPDKEQLFASASLDKTVKLWDIRSPKAALYDLMGHEDRVLCVDWSVPERIGSGSVDCSIKIFSC